jgi:hypothetical protein
VLPETLDELADWVIEKTDPYSALAIHPFVDNESRKKLERILFANSRLMYVFATVHYTPDSVLDILAAEFNEQLRIRVLKHPNTTARTLERVCRDGCSTKMTVLIAVHPNTPVNVLEEIEWQGLKKVRAALCGNRNSPLSVINELLKNSSLQEKKLIARNPGLNVQVLEKLWNEGDEYLRAEVVAHSSCPESLIVKAIKSRHVIERQKLASNPVIGDVIRHRLLMDDEPRVRAAIVRNQEVSEDELQKLCDDPSEQVRRNEARRNGLSEPVIAQLARDDDIWVRRWLARNAATSKKDLEKLAIDEDENVRRSVARNTSCPRKLLSKLADDDSAWVRAGVALRSDISKETLLRLIDDQDIDVLSAIGRNPNTPVKVLKRIAKNSDHDVRRSVVLNEKVTAKVLELFIEDPYPLNRVILASRLKFNRQGVWQLANDPDDEVRFSAIRTFAMQMVKDNNMECKQ